MNKTVKNIVTLSLESKNILNYLPGVFMYWEIPPNPGKGARRILADVILGKFDQQKRRRRFKCERK
jgi:hypothetical protein